MNETPEGFGGTDWQGILSRDSFLERDAGARAKALLDTGSMRVLLGPFDRLESPWLEPQGIVPQSDDGVVIARGTIGGQPVVVASIEQGFQGGGTGEVSGAKISQLLKHAVSESRSGHPTAAVLLLETGGVRLQEANLGLNAVAEICSAVLDLRRHVPVVGVVAGTVGSFGGVSIAAGLCSRLVVTAQARIGLNGPAVIEQEAGVQEFDSTDKKLIWAIDGGEQRVLTGLADILVLDDVCEIRSAVTAAVTAPPSLPGTHRSERTDVLSSRLALLDPAHLPEPRQLQQLWGQAFEVNSDAKFDGSRSAPAAAGRGATWLRALATQSAPVTPSVLRGDSADAVYLAVCPDPNSPFHRAREGQVGLAEALVLAEQVRDVITADASIEPVDKRAIVAVVDLPSQAYGRLEEMAGLHQAIAASVDAYHAARTAGHAVIALVVGQALSGGFLAHGLQANQILALDDPSVEIHAMHKPAAARITLRTVAELDELAQIIKPLSYNVRDWAQLGFCDGLLTVTNPDAPSTEDVALVHDAVAQAVVRARSGPLDLSNRMSSAAAAINRAASITVRDRLIKQWS
ncbi:biotin-independent malonate decarboxylase subunit beta [Mycobacteroides immunogenum]|uniref:biotin-independent malonate decarboxylase subunit beta n=1 Tax=Mycobacteroides immunogenum TaxID=83262 RepID=UPI0025B76226|nr:biotin-independent malonate decarboxylase subunit beta [Mycobacteroides immunogenum]WJR36127.1 biotin-independent malonate decarboxylase subunit beta [Mycobacteroides immunogenum]